MVCAVLCGRIIGDEPFPRSEQPRTTPRTPTVETPVTGCFCSRLPTEQTSLLHELQATFATPASLARRTSESTACYRQCCDFLQQYLQILIVTVSDIQTITSTSCQRCRFKFEYSVCGVGTVKAAENRVQDHLATLTSASHTATRRTHRDPTL